jgi:hypothetical protein
MAPQLGILALVGLLMLWSRLAFLDGSFWHDEVFTVLRFVNKGPSGIFDAYTPNNHVLYSLLTWATTGAIGHFEAAYRLWSVVPGIAAVGLVAWWAWRELEPLAGAAIVVLATISPTHLELTPQARGYGLGFLAGAGMLVFAARASARARTTDIALLGMFAALGIMTLPTIALTFAVHTAVLCAHPALRRRAVAAFGLVGVVSFVFYLPVLGDLWDWTSRPSATLPDPLPWHGFASSTYSDLVRPTLDALLPPDPAARPVLVIAYLALAALGCRWLLRHHERDVLLHIVLPVAATFVGLTVLGVYYIERFGTFLLMHVLVLLALGVTEIWHLVRRRRVLAALTALAAAALIAVGSMEVVDQTRRLPHENLKVVGELVRGTGIRPVITNTRRRQGLDYYVGSHRLFVQHGDVLERSLCFGPDPFVFIDHRFGGEPAPDIGCLERRGAIRVHVEQNIRGNVDVWIVPPGEGSA